MFALLRTCLGLRFLRSWAAATALVAGTLRLIVTLLAAGTEPAALATTRTEATGTLRLIATLFAAGSETTALAATRTEATRALRTGTRTLRTRTVAAG